MFPLVVYGCSKRLSCEHICRTLGTGCLGPRRWIRTPRVQLQPGSGSKLPNKSSEIAVRLLRLAWSGTAQLTLYFQLPCCATSKNKYCYVRDIFLSDKDAGLSQAKFASVRVSSPGPLLNKKHMPCHEQLLRLISSRNQQGLFCQSPL